MPKLILVKSYSSDVEFVFNIFFKYFIKKKNYDHKILAKFWWFTK